MSREFHIGAQNDGLFIVSGEKPAQGNDWPRHDADRTCVATVKDEREARRLVDEHAEMRDLLREAMAEAEVMMSTKLVRRITKVLNDG